MKNGVMFLLLGVAAAGFIGMMRIKTDVQQLARLRQNLAHEQIQLKENKRVLEAEYAMLANPVRLMKLADMRGFKQMTMADVIPTTLDELKQAGPGDELRIATQEQLKQAEEQRKAAVEAAKLAAQQAAEAETLAQQQAQQQAAEQAKAQAEAQAQQATPSAGQEAP